MWSDISRRSEYNRTRFLEAAYRCPRSAVSHHRCLRAQRVAGGRAGMTFMRGLELAVEIATCRDTRGGQPKGVVLA